MARTIRTIAAAAAACVIPALAGAAEWHTDTDRGVQVQASGGVLTFPGAVAQDVEPGGTYGVLFGIEPVPVAELEVAYQGAAYRTSADVSPQQETVVENGGQALIKISPQYGAFEPYVFGGFGLTDLNVQEEVGGPEVIEDDILAKLPVGAGVDLHIPAGDYAGTEVLIGARGIYNFVFDNQAYSLGADNDRSNDQIGATLNIGAQF